VRLRDEAIVVAHRAGEAPAPQIALLLFGATRALLLAYVVLLAGSGTALGARAGMTGAPTMRASASRTRFHAASFWHDDLLRVWCYSEQGCC
jgi:hypothetical protein